MGISENVDLDINVDGNVEVDANLYANVYGLESALKLIQYLQILRSL
jgi:hypothetical protein